jgi:hypothetical protein
LSAFGEGLVRKRDTAAKNGGLVSELWAPFGIIPSAEPINKKKPTPKNTPIVAVATSVIEAR